MASEWLEKMRSISAISRRSGDRVREGRDGAGRRWKATTDELDNTVVHRHKGREEVQDVAVKPQTITYQAKANVP